MKGILSTILDRKYTCLDRAPIRMVTNKCINAWASAPRALVLLPFLKPDTHQEEVIQHFKNTYGNDWDITKWMQILKVDIDFDSDEDVEEGMMGYYGKPKEGAQERYNEIISEIQADAKRDLGMEMPEELINEFMGLKKPIEHIKIFHRNAYKNLKETLGKEPTDKYYPYSKGGESPGS